MLRKTMKKGLFFILLFGFFACKQEVSDKKLVVENTPITAKIAVDSSAFVPSLIKEYKKGLEDTMSEVVGYSAMDMPKAKPESLLSNMVADFTYRLGKAYCAENHLSHSVDASIINIGGLRKALPKGNISLGDIYEISPFENKLYIVAMYGKDLWKLFDHITRTGGEGVGNIRLFADAKTRKLQKAFINNKPLETSKLYYIISIDYLINGGDGMVAFSKNVKSIDMNLKSRDALFQYVRGEYKANRPLKSKLDKRISYE